MFWNRKKKENPRIILPIVIVNINNFFFDSTSNDILSEDNSNSDTHSPKVIGNMEFNDFFNYAEEINNTPEDYQRTSWDKISRIAFREFLGDNPRIEAELTFWLCREDQADITPNFISTVEEIIQIIGIDFFAERDNLIKYFNNEA